MKEVFIINEKKIIVEAPKHKELLFLRKNAEKIMEDEEKTEYYLKKFIIKGLEQFGTEEYKTLLEHIYIYTNIEYKIAYEHYKKKITEEYDLIGDNLKYILQNLLLIGYKVIELDNFSHRELYRIFHFENSLRTEDFSVNKAGTKQPSDEIKKNFNNSGMSGFEQIMNGGV